MLLQTTIPDVTWVTSDVRAWLCEHDVKFDKDIGHVALVAARAGIRQRACDANAGSGHAGRRRRQQEAAAFDFSTLCPLETATWTTDFNWGCERAGAAQRAADAGVLRAAEYEKEDRRPRGRPRRPRIADVRRRHARPTPLRSRAAACRQADSLLPVSHEAISRRRRRRGRKLRPRRRAPTACVRVSPARGCDNILRVRTHRSKRVASVPFAQSWRWAPPLAAAVCAKLAAAIVFRPARPSRPKRGRRPPPSTARARRARPLRRGRATRRRRR